MGKCQKSCPTAVSTSQGQSKQLESRSEILRGLAKSRKPTLEVSWVELCEEPVGKERVRVVEHGFRRDSKDRGASGNGRRFLLVCLRDNTPMFPQIPIYSDKEIKVGFFLCSNGFHAP